MNIPLALEFSALCALQNTSDLNDSSLPGMFLVNKFSAHIVFPGSLSFRAKGKGVLNPGSKFIVLQQ